ncbi:ATP-binding protein [Pseudomonas aeruginosa]|uniref:ATP-binding protein n=1 Tax=Pseudomonas aeruginosa TaxID=287 RepID=UPI001047DB6B|nr:ATP-binding protein [Pseudomonas aeruginosa]ELN4740345.1 ATP-binding protein [Escherichia coli]MCO3747587.1 hypothetical protein [Pseudomonas aeruginosa]HCF0591516.1 ATP-binding protein [Pseudomonas aeruginosa]
MSLPIEPALPAAEQRSFNVHPGIIRHLIKEQAGTLVKAVAELVMNSVDAGATRIDLDFRSDGTFTVKDNGCGFGNREQIEKFFETFGTPHTKGDAKFGRFRIGRGQIMAFADTTWRSGNFKMEACFLSDNAPLGYALTETDIDFAGCQIDGVITEPSVLRELRYSCLVRTQPGDFWKYMGEDSFAHAVQYVDIPIFLGGEQINAPLSTIPWTFEDESGYYLLDNSSGLKVYNQGVFVKTAPRREFYAGGVFVSKRPIKLNMARNEWLWHECPVMWNLKKVCTKAFKDEVRKSGQMSDRDVGALVYRVAKDSESIQEDEAELLFDKRFIMDLSGKRLSPREFLSKPRFSVYDGVSSLIAERASAEGGFAILLPRMFNLADIELTDKVAVDFMHTVAALFKKFMHRNWWIRFVPFETIKESYSGITKSIPDDELQPQQRAALKAIRSVGRALARLTKDEAPRTRKIFAGQSDCADGWTNGFDYIGIDIKALKSACDFAGISALVSLTLHEFCHQNASSLDEHEHGVEFYKRFHDASSTETFASIIQLCHLRYMKIILKEGIDISGVDRITALDMRRLLRKSDIIKKQDARARRRRFAKEYQERELEESREPIQDHEEMANRIRLINPDIVVVPANFSSTEEYDDDVPF